MEQRCLFLMHAFLCWCHLVSSTYPSRSTIINTKYSFGTNNVSDRLALLSFKQLLISKDPRGALASWNDSLHLCQWQGVTCGAPRHPGRVTALDLDSLELTGPLSPSLGNLTFLRRIHLPSNRLNGNIPPELGLLPRLQHLNLSLNLLEGAIPETLLHSPHLRNISLRNNMLQGEIPYSSSPPPLLGNHSTLTSLDLSENTLIGSIPHSLGNASILTYLDLSNNNLTGSIPSSLGKLSSLTYFDMSTNNLTGEIPYSLWNLSFLTDFDVHTNDLSGTLPPELGHSLPRLQRLRMFENQFTGAIPVSISNASRLEKIQLYYNQFSSKIPWNLGTLESLYSLILGNNQLEATEAANDWRFFTGLTNCTRLHTFDVSNNRLVGVLPGSIANLSTTLVWFGMMGNRISGSIPPGIAKLVNLTQFRIKENLLTGKIPDTIGMLWRLQELYLAFNKFSGEIPPSISNLTQLNLLYLEGNDLTGTIPASLANCQNLLLLNLGYNRLTGTIPVELVSITSISIYLSFSDNLLTGPLPPEVGRLKNLDAIDVSGNRLSGEIPSSLGELQILEFLFMEDNMFHGTIPKSLSSLKGLQVLDLSHNNLSGEIPEFLKGFPYLDYLNLSFNNFEGEIPKGGCFANASIVSVLGNSKLCGGIPSLRLPLCSVQSTTTRKKHSSKSHLKVILLVVGAVIICSILSLCLVLACYYLRSRSRRPEGSTTVDINGSYQRVSYGELLKATDGFSAMNLIGRGSFGSVYKGMLGPDGNVVAVKALNLEQRGAAKSFMAECDALRNLRHRNLVKIITSCASVDFNGDDFKALVFEFMPNGSLEKWLHPDEQQHQLRRSLNLVQRLNIAIDVASALDYLHHHSQMPIVHCDLKPSNVLLDNDMIAHVGDFGLARFINTTVSKSSNNNITSWSNFQGTIGYVAPEYGITNIVSTQGDVYSYGILLLEMVTGKRPTDDAFPEGISLPQYVQMASSEKIMDLVDTLMFEELEDDEGSDNIQSISGEKEKIYECLASMLKIGLKCTRESTSERMQIGEVIKEIRAIKEALLREMTRLRT